MWCTNAATFVALQHNNHQSVVKGLECRKHVILFPLSHCVRVYAGYTQWTTAPNDIDFREPKEAQSNLLAATLEEYHLALATSGKDWFVAQRAAQTMEPDVRQLAT